jgi:hypothetical protein
MAPAECSAAVSGGLRQQAPSNSQDRKPAAGRSTDCGMLFPVHRQREQDIPGHVHDAVDDGRAAFGPRIRRARLTRLTVWKSRAVSKSQTILPSMLEYARRWPSADPEKATPGITAIADPGACEQL